VKNRLISLIAASVLAVAVAACQSGSVPIGGGAVAIRTAPAVAQACMDALAGGTLAANNESGLGITSADGDAMAVEWPFGYTARNNLGRIELLDETGTVVARVGDEITVGGGFGNQFWHACGPVAVTRPAS
jgi:hypothetical protein